MSTQCPLLKKKCIEHRCAWFTHLIGKDPQTGAQMDKWGCAVGWIPILLIENAQEVRQTAAAVESARNASATDASVVYGGLAALATAFRERETELPKHDHAQLENKGTH